VSRKFTLVAKRWSRLVLIDTEPCFRGLLPFADEQSAREAVLHVAARDEAFRKKYDGCLILVVPLDSAILIGSPASLRRTA